MKIVFLVASYLPHQLVSINTLIKEYGVFIHSFSISKIYKFIPNDIIGLSTYDPIQYMEKKDIYEKIVEIKPDIVVVAGWNIKKFVWVAQKVRREFKIPVVTYSDTQWRGTIRQRLNCILSPFYIKKSFSYIWVSGIYQFEYAKKLGFKKTQIIYNSLSCNLNLFKQYNIERLESNYPKNFIFVGRFVAVKGIDLLLQAWNQVNDKKGWTLTLIGDGHLKEKYSYSSDIILKDFMSQKDLVKEFSNSGCFIISSLFEQWSLVIHEAVAAGLPIIASNECGATPHFLINGYNGYVVNPQINEIKIAIEKIIKMDALQLNVFSKNSLKLAESITPETSAAQLMSILR